MRVIVLIIFLFRFFSLGFSQPSCDDDILKYPLKSISVFCQSNTDTPISEAILTYGKENHLEQYSLFRNESETNRIVFLYNELGLLTSKEFYSFERSNTIDRTRIFKYDGKNQLIYEGYDDEDGNNTKNEYTYNEYGQLIATTGACNYTHWSYTYEYDSQNRVSSKYNNTVLEVSYEYSNDLLVKEIRHNRNNHFETIYEYDDHGFLLSKKENGSIIEKNLYLRGRLVERWTYYFGIDPCFRPCCSQYITTYGYY